MIGLGTVARRRVARERVSFSFVWAEHSLVLIVYPRVANTTVPAVLISAIKVGAIKLRIIIPVEADVLMCGTE